MDNQKILVVMIDENEYAACYTEDGEWKAELCATRKSAYRTLAVILNEEAGIINVSPSLYYDIENYYFEDKKEHPDFSHFDPERITLLEAICENFSKRQIRQLDKTERMLARQAIWDEMERCR